MGIGRDQSGMAKRAGACYDVGSMTGIEPQRRISLSFDRGTLLLTGLERKELPNVPGPSVWMWDARVGAWRCDAIHYPSIRGVLNRRFTSCLQDDMPQPARVSWPKVELPQPRREQAEALAA